jgi:outer membrane scaffolding protein for murein synthesis (MipA/OmpV family)
MSLVKISGPWRLFGFGGVDLIHGAQFEDSPLIRRRSNWNVGLGVAFVIASSGERASYRE